VISSESGQSVSPGVTGAKDLTLRELGQVFAFEQIVRLQENLSQSRRPGRVVPIVETVETVKLLCHVSWDVSISLWTKQRT
jgi:hypothetical protein